MAGKRSSATDESEEEESEEEKEEGSRRNLELVRPLERSVSLLQGDGSDIQVFRGF